MGRGRSRDGLSEEGGGDVSEGGGGGGLRCSVSGAPTPAYLPQGAC